LKKQKNIENKILGFAVESYILLFKDMFAHEVCVPGRDAFMAQSVKSGI